MALSNPTSLATAVSSGTNAAVTSGSFTPAASSLVVVLVTSFTASGTAPITYTITDTLGGYTWTKVEGTNGTTGNTSTTTLFYAVAPGSPSAGTVTVTPSSTGAANFGIYMQPFQITGGRTSGPVGATGTSTTATVALSAAPASTSEVLVLGVAGLGSDPLTTQPSGFTALYTDVHSGSYTYSTAGYKNGSASQSNAFGGSLANGASLAVEVLAGTSSTVTVTNPGSLTATVGTAFSRTISASTTSGTITGFSATGLPPGLSINSSGLISGTPTTAGTYSSVTVTATDSNGSTGNTTFTITVAAAAAPVTIPTSGWQVLIAFQNNPLDDPASITTVASAGTPGNPGTPPTLGGVNVWTDVTQYVRHISTSRGRQHELSRFEAGSLSVDLWNLTGVWNPWNTSGPFYGYLLPGKLVQVRYTYNAVTYKVWTGHLHALPIQWPDGQIGTARLEASDAFRLLALADITNTAYATGVLALTPKAYYRLGDQPGSIVAKDSSGNGLDGSYKGTFALGYAGALVADVDTALNVTGGGYAQLSNSASLTTSDQSVAGWALMHALPASGTGMVMYYQAGVRAADSLVYEVELKVVGDGANSAHFVLTVGNPALANTYTSANGTAPTDGLYHHYAVPLNGTTGFNPFLYVDGVSVSLTFFSGGTAAYVSSTNSLVLLGATGGGTTAVTNTSRWNGALDEWATYSVNLTAAQVLAQYQSGSGQWANQSSGTRIGKVLDTVGWSSGARVISTGASTVQAVTSSLTTTKSLSYMQLVELTEDGALFMDGAGRVKFLARTDIQTMTTVAATFGDNTALTGGTEIPFQPGPDLALDDLDIWIEVPVQRVNGVTQTSADTTSQQQYGRRTLSGLSGLLNTTDQESAYRSQYDLDKYRQPLNRFRSLVTRPAAQTSTIATLMVLDMLSRAVVNRASLPGGGTSFTQTASVERIEHEVDLESGDWVMAVALSPVDARAYWILGDSTYSVLGTTTRLAY